MKITKKLYLQSFAAIVVLLALVRCVFPSVAEPRMQTVSDANPSEASVADPDSLILARADSVNRAKQQAAPVKLPSSAEQPRTSTTTKHPIRSVASYADAFPDMQDVQIQAANKFGVSPVQNRAEAERRKMELVYVGANPYFFVEPLRSSIPYLVPRASVLLQDIGLNFFDSLQIKGVPLNKIIVTSVLRSKDDVNRLRGFNGNATENSCHLYGTTFDICYNRYKTVAPPDQPRRAVQNDTLKWVLSEVLRDLRQQGRCYVKYEVKQGCFHITTR